MLKTKRDLFIHKSRRFVFLILLRCLLHAGKGFFLGSFQSLTLDPDASLQPEQRSAQLKESLHADYPFYSTDQALPAGVGSPFTIQSIWMITDFDEENGNTLTLSKQHHHRRDTAAPLGRSDN